MGMGKVRSNAKRAAVVATVLVVLTCVALFIRAYQAAAPTDSEAHDGSISTDGPGPLPSGSASDKPTVHHLLPTSSRLAPYTLTPAEQPGFKFAGQKQHKLVLSASSARAISRVGYLAPTSPDHSYGDVKKVPRTWSVRTTVTGGPEYAVIFIQAGASGTPITCTITVDGVILDKKTTSGAYGRQVCVG
jgi:hypothetical protein